MSGGQQPRRGLATRIRIIIVITNMIILFVIMIIIILMTMILIMIYKTCINICSMVLQTGLHYDSIQQRARVISNQVSAVSSRNQETAVSS